MKEEAAMQIFNGEVKMPEVKNVGKRKKRSNSVDSYAEQFLSDPTHENFNELWKRMYWGLCQHAYKLVHDNDMTREIVIRTMEKAWTKYNMFDPNKAKFSTWLYKICFNESLAYLYSKKKDNFVDNDISDLYSSTLCKGDSTVDTFCDDTDKYSDKFDKNANGELYMMGREEIIKKMYDTSVNIIKNFKDERVTNCMLEKHVNGLKLEQIAKKYDYPVSSVKNWIHKGKLEMNKIFKEKYTDLYDMYIDVK